MVALLHPLGPVEIIEKYPWAVVVINLRVQLVCSSFCSDVSNPSAISPLEAKVAEVHCKQDESQDAEDGCRHAEDANAEDCK